MSLALAAAILALAGSRPPPPPCRLDRPLTCSAQELFIGANVGKFLGKARVDYLFPGSLADQQWEVWTSPDDVTPIGDYYIAKGCRVHSCFERGALIVSREGKVESTAILHLICPTGTPYDERCYQWYVLTVFVRDPASARIMKAHMTDWAQDQLREMNELVAHDKSGALMPNYLLAVEVYAAENGHPRPISRESVGDVPDLPIPRAPR